MVAHIRIISDLILRMLKRKLNKNSLPGNVQASMEIALMEIAMIRHG